jgi:hypothetical protein
VIAPGTTVVFPASRSPDPDREEYARRFERAGMPQTAIYTRVGYPIVVGHFRALYQAEAKMAARQKPLEWADMVARVEGAGGPGVCILRTLFKWGGPVLLYVHGPVRSDFTCTP